MYQKFFSREARVCMYFHAGTLMGFRLSVIEYTFHEGFWPTGIEFPPFGL
jgi:hypothetical protein